MLNFADAITQSWQYVLSVASKWDGPSPLWPNESLGARTESLRRYEGRIPTDDYIFEVSKRKRFKRRGEHLDRSGDTLLRRLRWRSHGLDRKGGARSTYTLVQLFQSIVTIVTAEGSSRGHWTSTNHRS